MPNQRTAATRLDGYLEQWLGSQLKDNAGHEQEALIELIRSVDLHSYFLHFFRPPELTDKFALECNWIRHGIGPILRAFLPKLEHFGDGIPLRPSTAESAAWADEVLAITGKLAMLRRLAHSERYGLVRCDVQSDEHVSIHIIGRDVENFDRKDLAWLIAKDLDCRKNHQESLNKQINGWARDRIDGYVGIWRDHFIRYDSDRDLLRLYQEQATSSMITSPEADALPDEAVIGPRTFGEWKQVAVTALARASLHLSFATRLCALNEGKLDLRNLLTVHVRHEDLRAVWSQQTGIVDDYGLDEIADIFMLTAEHADEYFSNYDYPLPYNIRFGKYFALLPQFGYLGNACTYLVTELKRKYRNDWDKAVNQREAKFQRELYALLSEPNYIRGRENFTIRNSTGGTETDIDAVLFEKASNCLYLFQLKWFDVFAHGLKERQSKLTNLLKANKWVEQVSHWTTSMAHDELLSRLALKGLRLPSPPFEIRLVVLTRYSARFSGTHQYDERAAWMSWPRLCRLVTENEGHASPLKMAWHAVKADGDIEYRTTGEHSEYVFPNLRVDVYDQEEFNPDLAGKDHSAIR